MKICKIHIKGFQQFEDTVLDFTHPETGEPLEKICFIGRNGTGKSTLLRLMASFLHKMRTVENQMSNTLDVSVLVKLKYHETIIYLLCNGWGYITTISIDVEVEKWFADTDFSTLDQRLRKGFDVEFDGYKIKGKAYIDEFNRFVLRENDSDLVMYSPPEPIDSDKNQDPQQANLNEALQLFNSFPFYHDISEQNTREFWKLLIYLIKKRENEQIIFENKSENLHKTKKQLIDEFEKTNPKIEEKLAEIWNEILGKASLEMDLESLKKPVQLNDNLQAYIRHKATKQRINYNQLSTGIRNFIFRIGHIYSLYFNREIKRGFLLVDEPENSLFPDFLFNLMELYEKIVIDKNGENNTQFFVATHSPIVAAQFQPYERIILEWDDNGHVTAHKGHAPVGDDPNDVLEQDFGLENLMGKEGQKMWKEYLDLRKKLRRTEDAAEKDKLLTEINKIGNDYNFEE